jgi:hypothetical protein
MTRSFDRTPEASWYAIVCSYGMTIAGVLMVIAASLAVGLVIYYAL